MAEFQLKLLLNLEHQLSAWLRAPAPPHCPTNLELQLSAWLRAPAPPQVLVSPSNRWTERQGRGIDLV